MVSEDGLSEEETEENILDSRDDENFTSEDEDCSTEDKDDCYNGNLADFEKDLNHSKEL